MIITWGSGSPADNMEESLLVNLRPAILRHPWWTARAQLILALLRARGLLPSASILEAGCGWGTNLERLEAAGFQVTGLDISRRALELIDRPDRRLIEADLSNDLPDSVPQYDCVLALDVIEHIDDDSRTLCHLARLVKPSGLVIVSVPALPELYSEFDEVQGHRRRYTIDDLDNCLRRAGLVGEDIRWWGQWMVPLARRQRTRKRRRSGDSAADIYRRYLALPPWPAPWLMRLMFLIDLRRTLGRRNVVGTSLIAIATRPMD
jgi:SAM-dependent methyltransferase